MLHEYIINQFSYRLGAPHCMIVFFSSMAFGIGTNGRIVPMDPLFIQSLNQSICWVNNTEQSSGNPDRFNSNIPKNHFLLEHIEFTIEQLSQGCLPRFTIGSL